MAIKQIQCQNHLESAVDGRFDFLQPVASNLTARKMHERTRFPSQEFRQRVTPFEGPGSGVSVDLSAGIISPRVAPLTVDTFVSRASPDTKAGPGKGMSWC